MANTVRTSRGKLKHELSPKMQEFETKVKQRSYLVVPLAFLKIGMKQNDALILAYLWNVRRMVEISGELRSDGYFFCMSDRVARDLKISRQTLWRSLVKLQDLTFVRMKEVTGDPRRYVKINLSKITDALDKLDFVGDEESLA